MSAVVNMGNLRAEILDIQDLKVKQIDVPAWNKKVFIRQLSAHDRAELNDKTLDIQESEKLSDQVTVMATSVSYFLSDANGNRLLSDEDVPALTGKSIASLEHIFVEGMRFSALGSEGKAESKKK